MKKTAFTLLLCAAAAAPVAHADAPANATYIISAPAAPAFMPSKVYDDGTFTFIQLQKPYRGAVPVVYAVAGDGTREALNFRWDEPNARLLVMGLIDHAVLVHGAEAVAIHHS